MTKAGEGNSPVSHNYQKELIHQCAQFLKALREFHKAQTVDRPRLSIDMQNLVKLILSSVSELKRTGIRKEGFQLEKAHSNYMNYASDENLAALEHIVSTLQQFNC